MVTQCDVCQATKYDPRAPMGLLQPLPIPGMIWEDLSIDFIKGLPISRGFDVILVNVNKLSKYVHFLGLKYSFTAKSIA